ncbi:MAG: Nif3-like dinuclear metal center hexameric protein [Candidatus Sericytochromatia bacterium]|nr:Nif3-like dinuclear metal center hexameric protein [Candidatus Tanganyikabacteria bacterium]
MERSELVRWLEVLAPPTRAASWDRVGLQVGRDAGPVTGVCVSVNPSMAAVRAARAMGANVLVTHHPLIFKPLSEVRTDRESGRVLAEALAGDLMLYAAHTNLDVTACNRRLSDLMGWDLDQILVPEGRDEEGLPWGLGLWGQLAAPRALDALCREVGRTLQARSLRLVRGHDREVASVAVCSGAGGDFWPRVAALGIDLYITGEIRYHDALDASAHGVCVLEVGHQASEEPVVDVVVGFLRERLPRTVVVQGFREPEPFEVLS